MNTLDLQSGPEMDAMCVYCDMALTPSPQQLANLRRDVLGRLPATASTPSRPTRRRRGLLVTAATAVTAVVGLTALLLSTTGQPAGRDEAVAVVDAPTMLRLAADHADAAQPLVVNDHDYVYEKDKTVRINKAPAVDNPKELAWFVETTTSEQWSLANGLTPIRQVYTTGIDTHPLTAADAAKLKGSTYPGLSPYITTYNGAPGPIKPSLENPTLQYLNSLPTDPSALIALFNQMFNPPLPAPSPSRAFKRSIPTDTEIFIGIAIFMTKTDALLSPQLRAGLFRALASLPGVERLPGQTDLAGRKGVGVSHSNGGSMRVELVFDPTTSRVFGSRTVVTSPEPYAGGVLAAGTVDLLSTTETKIVASVGATS